MPKYKSKFEASVGKHISHKASYEPIKVQYTIPETSHFYHPDFVFEGVWYELKGKLDLTTRKKMKYIQACHPNQRIVFVFQNPNVKLNKASKTTYAQWATKNGFEVITPQQLIGIVNDGSVSN